MANDAPLRAAAELSRLRADLERVTLERDRQYDENVNRIAAEGAAIMRADAAEATVTRLQAELDDCKRAARIDAAQHDDARADLAAARSRIARLEKGLREIADGDWSWGVEHDKKAFGKWSRLARALLSEKEEKL